MDLSAWVVYTFIAALVMAASLVHYRWREPAGRGRTALGVMRGATLAVVLLVLFDPMVPAGTDPPLVALVDASLSMSLRGEDGAARWDRAREVVDAAGPERIQLFGTSDLPAVPDLEAAAPTATGSRLAPALRAAVEAGAGRVLVVTDGAVEDAAEVRRVVEATGVPIEVRRVGDETRMNLAVEELDAPRWLEVGEESVVRAGIARLGDAGPALPDSATVTLTREGVAVAEARVAVPPAGRTSSAELRFRPEPSGGVPVRLDVRVSPGGAVTDDDARSTYVRITEEPAEVALLSLRPDQEPRFLLPVLQRALGVPVRGWIGIGAARFLRLGTGSEAGAVTPGEAVRRAVENAGIVVLHGLDASAPGWARDVLAAGERVLVFPSDPTPALPFEPGPLRAGDWYVAEEVPSSPVAPLLAGVDTDGVPPLSALRTRGLPDGYWTPLTARLGRQGPAYPVAAMGTADGRRLGVALGEGYWRWAFSGPNGRDLYERLWAAVGGWLMEDLEGVDREAVRPVSRVVERGEPVRWLVGSASDSVTITMTRDTTGAAPTPGDGSEPDGPALDTTVVVEEGRAATVSLPPGHYRYVARAGAEAVEGALTVESYSSELLDAAVALDVGPGAEGPPRAVRQGRPLRTTPWPYALVVALLCAEWVLRRRWGLR